MLPSHLRSRLKRPIGILVGSAAEAFEILKGEVGQPVMLVGDRVSSSLCGLGVDPLLHIVDLRERRLPTGPPPCDYRKLIRVVNPPGMVTRQALEALSEALEGRCQTRIVVEGEEDMLSIPLIAGAGRGLVVYGQPGEGIVIVDASNPEYVAAAREVLDMMSGERINRDPGPT